MSKKKAQKKKSITKGEMSLRPLAPWVKYGTLLFFVLFSFVLYYQCIPFGYVLDDKIVFTENAYTKEGINGIGKLLTTESFEGYFGEQKNLLQGGRYRPLSLISFAIEYEFFGLTPAVSHSINILLYGLTAFLAFIVLRHLFAEKTYSKNALFSLSLLTALIFLVHPIHTEAVANVKGRDEIMAFFLSMLSLFFALQYMDSAKWKYLLFIFLSFFTGLIAKENTITFFAIIPFGLVLFRPMNGKKLVKIIAVLLAGILIYLFIRYQAIGFLLNSNPSRDIMNNPFVGMTSSQRLATIFYTLLIYLKLNIVPYPLTHDYYPYHIPVMDFRDIWVWLSILLHLILAFLVFYFWKKRPKIAFAIGFYIAAMSIVSNLVVDVGTFMNERFAFTASLGFCILIVYLLKILNRKFFNRNRKILIALILIPAIAYSAITITRVPVWESALTLNSAAIKVSKNSARANSFMSTALFEEYKVTTDPAKRLELLNKAQPYAIKALSIYPDYYNGNLMRAGIAAELHKMNGDLDALLSEFMEIIKIRPDVGFVTEYLEYLNGRADASQLIEFYINAGRTILAQGKNLTWAIHYLRMGYNLDSGNREIRELLAQAYTSIGRPDEAAKYR